ncbi:hypothetical protein BC829DRAFT_207397 [Chytridium lagenaria]|nr:hypothetical protein BC829DRAFT_207397 [Chytridium lagenaria]
MIMRSLRLMPSSCSNRTHHHHHSSQTILLLLVLIQHHIRASWLQVESALSCLFLMPSSTSNSSSHSILLPLLSIQVLPRLYQRIHRSTVPNSPSCNLNSSYPLLYIFENQVPCSSLIEIE